MTVKLPLHRLDDSPIGFVTGRKVMEYGLYPTGTRDHMASGMDFSWLAANLR